MPAIHSGKKRKGRSTGGKAANKSTVSAGIIIYIMLLLILVAGSIAGTMYYYEIMQPFDYQGAALEEIKATGTLVLVARKNLKPNEPLTGAYEVIGLPYYALPGDALSEIEVSRLLSVGEIKSGTILTRSNTYNPEAVTQDPSAVNYLVTDLFKYDWLNNGDFIDVRLLRYNTATGRTDDYVVLSKKRLTLSDSRKFATVALNENEIALIRRADVEARLAKKSSKDNPYEVIIYATVYREPGSQKPSVVTYSGINVVVSTPNGGMSLDDILKNNIDITEDMTMEVIDKEKPEEQIGISEDITDTEVPEAREEEFDAVGGVSTEQSKDGEGD